MSQYFGAVDQFVVDTFICVSDATNDFIYEFLPRWLAGLAVSEDLIKVLVGSQPL